MFFTKRDGTQASSDKEPKFIFEFDPENLDEFVELAKEMKKSGYQCLGQVCEKCPIYHTKGKIGCGNASYGSGFEDMRKKRIDLVDSFLEQYYKPEKWNMNTVTPLEEQMVLAMRMKENEYRCLAFRCEKCPLKEYNKESHYYNKKYDKGCGSGLVTGSKEYHRRKKLIDTFLEKYGFNCDNFVIKQLLKIVSLDEGEETKFYFIDGDTLNDTDYTSHIKEIVKENILLKEKNEALNIILKRKNEELDKKESILHEYAEELILSREWEGKYKNLEAKVKELSEQLDEENKSYGMNRIVQPQKSEAYVLQLKVINEHLKICYYNDKGSLCSVAHITPTGRYISRVPYFEENYREWAKMGSKFDNSVIRWSGDEYKLSLLCENVILRKHFLKNMWKNL